jgi:small-conductance mechanosensitive channel
LLITQRVENLSLENSRMLLSNTYWVGLESDAEQVARLLVEAALRADRVLADPEPMALLSEVSPQGLRWTLNFWMDAPLTGQGLVRSDVNLAVLASLRQAGVALAAAPKEVLLRQ